MKTFIITYFILSILSFILQAIQISINEYPLTKKYTLGYALSMLFITFAFMIWAGIILFVMPAINK